MNQELNKLSIEVDILKTENANLQKLLIEKSKKDKKVDDILKALDILELDMHRDTKYALMQEEINNIKGEEFFNSKDFQKYAKETEYTFNTVDLTIFIGSKKIATIEDVRFFNFIVKLISIAHPILDYYRKSIIVLGAKKIVEKIKEKN